MSIEEAVQYLQGKNEKRKTDDQPSPANIVAALIAAEKQSRKEKRRYDYENLLGTWQLRFVSGTKTQKRGASSKPTKKPGPGRFIPQWIDISITYGAQDSLLTPELVSSSHSNQLGAVANRVRIGASSLQLSGPTRYWPTTNSLGFDFVYLQLAIGSWTLYRAPVRGGIERAQTFADQSLKDQAFFTFFAVTQDYIAARGKGGGLALWTRAADL